MGKAGKALKQVLEIHGISQNKLAIALEVRASVIYRWVHELTDPTGESIAEIAKALQGIDPAAADEFVRLYLGDFMQNQEQTTDSD
jgi:transcriptional regulator with XRE-family HTH domain